MEGDAEARFGFHFQGEDPWLLTITGGEVTPSSWNGEKVEAAIRVSGAGFLLGLLLEKTGWRLVLSSRQVSIRGNLRVCNLLRRCVPLLTPTA